MYALVDCNSFYCSCERVFRPELKSKPVIVLSNNDGCAVSRSPEAKRLGIKMGDPFFKIKELCAKNNVAVFSSNFANYSNLSNRVMNIIDQCSPHFEVYSIDEAFSRVDGIEDIEKWARLLREKILKETKIPVSIGIGRTKVLAKLANRFAKENENSFGVFIFNCEKEENEILKKMKVSSVWGIGKQSSLKLKSIGIKTAFELKFFSNEARIQKLLTKVGLQIKHELMGVDCLSLNLHPEKKQIMCSRTFGSPIYEKNSLRESIANYVTNAATKLRRQNSLCTQVSIFARTNAFKDIPQYQFLERVKLVTPTCDTRKLIKEAFKLVDRGFKGGYEYSKAGVRLDDFFSQNEYQTDLFAFSDTKADLELMYVIDRINLRLGEDKVRSASCGFNSKAWQMNRRFKSPRYFTHWCELPVFNKNQS